MDIEKKNKKENNFLYTINKHLSRLPQISPEKFYNPKLWFVVFLGYLSYINFFILKTTPEIIFIQFFVLVMVFNKIRTKDFAKTWIPFISFFLLYEFLRGFADDLSPFYDKTLFYIYNLEIRLFGDLPTHFLQQHINKSSPITHFSIFFYTVFFYYSFLVAFLIWLKYPKIFLEYLTKFLLLSFIGLVVFFLVPTAPPWMIDEIRDIDIVRYIYSGSPVLESFKGFTLYRYFVFGNPVAALPSLHVAWPSFSTLFLIHKFQNKYLYLLLIIPITISFSVILAAEHYVIDVFAGWILAWTLTIFSINSKSAKAEN